MIFAWLRWYCIRAPELKPIWCIFRSRSADGPSNSSGGPSNSKTVWRIEASNLIWYSEYRILRFCDKLNSRKFINTTNIQYRVMCLFLDKLQLATSFQRNDESIIIFIDSLIYFFLFWCVYFSVFRFWIVVNRNGPWFHIKYRILPILVKVQRSID